MIHLVNPASPKKSYPVGRRTLHEHRSIELPSTAYCGAECKRRPTGDFFEAVNYTGAGLAREHERVCPKCKDIHEASK